MYYLSHILKESIKYRIRVKIILGFAGVVFRNETDGKVG